MYIPSSFMLHAVTDFKRKIEATEWVALAILFSVVNHEEESNRHFELVLGWLAHIFS